MDQREEVGAKCRSIAAELDVPLSIVDNIVKLIAPSIRLVPQKTEIKLPLGSSFLGGQPDLPPDLAWPEFSASQGAGPLEFLAQIHLADLGGLSQHFPKNGRLYFFFGSTEDFVDVGKVLFSEAGEKDLTRAEFPASLPKERRYLATKVCPRIEFTVPSPGDLELPEDQLNEHLELWDTLREECESMQGFGPWNTPKHRMLGHPELIQGPGLASNARLLLQVDSDRQTRMLFGDGGRVYYLYSKEDQKKQIFSKASALLEMS